MQKVFHEDDTVKGIILPVMVNRTSVTDAEDEMWAKIAAYTQVPNCRAQLDNLQLAEFYCMRLVIEKWSWAEGFKFPPSMAEWEKLYAEYPSERGKKLKEKLVAPMLTIRNACILFPNVDFLLEPPQPEKRKRQAKEKKSGKQKAEESQRRKEGARRKEKKKKEITG